MKRTLNLRRTRAFFVESTRDFTRIGTLLAQFGISKTSAIALPEFLRFLRCQGGKLADDDDCPAALVGVRAEPQ
jgi:hypothetical protein